jgi:hypothetical protein
MTVPIPPVDGQAPPTDPPANPGDSSAPTTPPAAPTPQPSAPTPQAPANPEDDSALSELPSWAQKHIKDLRKESGDYRTKFNDASTKLTEIERAALTESERTKLDLQNLQTSVLPEKDQQIRELQVQIAATQQNVVDPEAVVKFLDWSKVDAGMSVNDAINELLEAKPYLKAQAVTPPPATPTAPPSSSSPASPAGGTGTAARFTQSQLGSMSTAEYETNRDAIYEAMRDGRVDYDK